MVWSYFTMKTFRICEQILLFPLEEGEKEPPEYECENCGKSFLHYDDGPQQQALCNRCAEVARLLSDVVTQKTIEKIFS